MFKDCGGLADIKTGLDNFSLHEDVYFSFVYVAGEK